ncbi:MAG TPA: chromate efflux transporter [Candidatus Limnocylindrales bacterium]|nr:chromate efflux transporter [Candidatus Limnocylindrales bacterium]
MSAAESLAPSVSADVLTSVSYDEARAVWLRVALHSFGGPAAQIAVMHRILVDEKRWVSEERFLHALNYCMLLPGPEAQQLATYIGWLMHGYRGGLTAGLLFVAPGFAAIMALSILYVSFQDTSWLPALLFGLKAAVLAVVLEAVQRISRRVARTQLTLGISALAFTALFFFDVPFPAIVLVAGLTGWAVARWRPQWMPVKAPAESDGPTRIVDRRAAEGTAPTLGRSLQVLAVWGAIWAAPVVAVVLVFGAGSVFTSIAVFFSKAAVVTFGGAYAVLAYIAQQAVEHYRWMQPGEMLDGLGMAETTPGPLIQVVQFVGFLAAHRNPQGLEPMTAALLGATLTTWVTYAPCFLWIFLGAPYVETLRRNRALAASLTAITAAVLGVIVNLAVWFALHVLFSQVRETAGPLGLKLTFPDLATLDVLALLIAVASFLALMRWHVGMTTTLVTAMLAGMALQLLR